MPPRFPSAREQRPQKYEVSITAGDWFERVARRTLGDTESNTSIPQRLGYLRGIGSSVLDPERVERIVTRVAAEEGVS